MLLEEIELEPQIGPEVVGFLIDSNPEELRKGSLNLRLKAGLIATGDGPVLFLIWWVPSFEGSQPLAIYEQIMNPLEPRTSELLRRLVAQTHFHVLLLGSDGVVRTAYEYRNTFAFENVLSLADQAKSLLTGTGDFLQATRSYQAQIDVPQWISEPSSAGTVDCW